MRYPGHELEVQGPSRKFFLSRAGHNKRDPTEIEGDEAEAARLQCFRERGLVPWSKQYSTEVE